MNPFLFFLLVFLFFQPNPAEAGIGDKLDDWFNNQNFNTSTRPGIYETQSARYATLGGISYRAPITQPYRFLTIQTPRFSAGCGGIDLYTGGFSVMNASQFVDALRAIGQNAVSLAFMLAIQIVSPQLSGIMEDIQSWANEYLTMGMDSCEAATKLVGGALEFFGQKEGNCTIKRMQTTGEDYNTANHYCTTGGRIKATEASGGGEDDQIVFTKGNLTWFVLMQNFFFTTDTQFAELIMNMVGTVIYRDDGGGDTDPTGLNHIPAALNEDGTPSPAFENMIAALMYGSDAAVQLLIYRCQSPTATPMGCQTIHADRQSINPATWGDGLHGKIRILVQSIVSKIRGDAALTPTETGLIGASKIPLYRFLTAASAAFPNAPGSSIDVTELTDKYTNLFARNILLTSLNNVLGMVEFQALNLPDKLSDTPQVEDFEKDLRVAIRGVAAMTKETEDKAGQYFELLKQIREYEKEIMTNLGKGFMQAARWGR
ncbi:MAG: conjugal transfer protein TraH [Nitrospira sp.]|nr:conjugal transfer protein TraH [Nitrospira sp.]MDE0404625.1 conjugal transfer protein TraH [Nitrospira sp.]MDE0486186.1 conjugal transfer protein TraH [Nitrospira sp.]